MSTSLIVDDVGPIPSKRENDEVMGWKLDAVARGVIINGAAVFISTALLKLAKQAAGCYDDDQECDGRVYGMRPSSILTNIVTAVGLITAVCMPLVGSIIDHTRYRRAVGRVSAAIITILILVQICVLREATWFLAAILQVFIASIYMVHLCVSFAYLPELTTHHPSLVTYAAQFVASQFAASVTFLLFMVGILSLVGVVDSEGGAGQADEELQAARLSQSVVTIVCFVTFGYAWTRLFRNRPASQIVPEGCSVCSAGFIQIFRTSRILWKHHHAIKWFLVSAACTQGALTSFSSIAITFMTDQLLFTSKENGIAILLLQLSAVPGTRIGAMVSHRFNPIRSLQACLTVWVITIGTAACVLRGGSDDKEQQQLETNMAYGFAVFWGLSYGWVYPTEKAMFCTIIPMGQEAELMGNYLCACQILSWLPPLVFTLLNEAGVSMRIGLFSLNFFFLTSFGVLFLVGDYDKATAHAKAFEGGIVASDAAACSSNTNNLDDRLGTTRMDNKSDYHQHSHDLQ